MYKVLKYMRYFIIAFFFLLAGCEFTFPGADEKFGKQNFVSAISLIELHNTRYGEYPESLQDLKFLGDWDSIWLSSVQYKKITDGYNLFVVRGLTTEPSLKFPEEFKQGLGIKKTNVQWVSPDSNSY